MVNYIFGRSGFGKSSKVIEMIKEDIKNNNDVYLIIPQQQSVLWDTKIANELSPSACIHLHVTNFSQLADLVNRKFGGLNYKYANKGEKALIMWSAILSVQTNLKVYKSASEQEDRLISILLTAIEELKSNKITPSIIEDTIAKLDTEDTSSAKLADKLRDLSLIMAAYNNLLAERFGEADDIQSKLEKTLKQNNFFKNTSVYMDSFYAFTPVQLGIIESIMRQSSNFTITFTYDNRPGGKDQSLAFTKRMYRSISNLTNKLSITPNNIYLDVDYRHISSNALKYLEQNCWNDEAEKFNKDPSEDELKIIYCTDRYNEADAVANEILSLVHNGNSWQDIAIIAHSIEKLRGILDTTLDAKNIPYHFSKRSELASEPATRLWLSALSIIANSWRAEDIIAFAKTNLFDLSSDEIDLFEKYILTWNINGRSSYEHEWNMNPSGYSESFTTKDTNTLELVNNAKNKITVPLINFANAVKTNGNMAVRDIAKACYDLFVEIKLYERLEEQANTYDKLNKLDEAIQKRQVFKTLCDVLDSMVFALPDSKLSCAKFSKLLRKVIDEKNIGTIPAAMDEVIVGSASTLRTNNVKYVFLLGAFDGEFPCYSSDDSVFSDIDKILLEGCDVDFIQTEEERTEAEKFHFYHSLAIASKGVRVFVPQVNGNYTLIPSDGTLRILELFNNIKTKNWNDATAEDIIWDKDSLLQATTIFKDNEKIKKIATQHDCFFLDSSLLNADNCNLAKETAKSVFKNHMTLSHSKLEEYVKCKFDYICKYVLNIEEDQKAKINSLNIGNYVHQILEECLKNNKFPIPENIISEVIDNVTNKYINNITNGHITPRLNYLFSKLKKNAFVFISYLSDEFATSKFTPAKFELQINTNSPTYPKPLIFNLPDKSSISITGKIDRVDTYNENGNTYVKVVDYKTGQKAFSLDKIYHSLDMQLLLYLFTICKNQNDEFKKDIKSADNIIPAGILYLNVSPEVINGKPKDQDEAINQSKNNIKPSGLILNDRDIIKKMDFSDYKNPKHLPIKYLKNSDDFDSYSKNNVKTLEEFEELYQIVSNNIVSIGTEMRNGEAESKPSEFCKSPCDYCKYKPICRHIQNETEENSEEEVDNG